MKEHDVINEQINSKRVIYWVYPVLCSILTVVAFQIKSDLTSEEQISMLMAFGEFTKSFQDYNIITVLLVVVLICFYRYVSEIGEADWRNLLLACLFSCFMVLGDSYDKTNSWSLVFNVNNLQWLKALLSFLGYAIFFYYCISFIFHKADIYNTHYLEIQSKNKLFMLYIKWLKNRPFATAFVTLCICYIPYVIVSYPAIASYDMGVQIIQSYPEVGIYAPAYTQDLALKEGVYLNNHHPIIHTLLLHYFLELGNKLLGSYDIGLFLLASCQTLVMFCAIALFVALLIEINVKESIVCVVLLYYVISPRIQNYMFFMTKDIFFSAFMLMFLVCLFYINRKCKRKYYILFGVSVLGIFLFRNDGKYLLILSFILIGILLKKLRKYMFACVITIVVLNILWFNVLLPACGVIPGSIREVLSIPFQQTARYIRDSSAPLTEDEKEAISAVLNYEVIAERYNPELSDNVKSTYRNNASKEDLKRYFVIYMKMFLKHPSHYIQATLNNYYYYFYPGPRLGNYYGYHYSASNFNNLNEQMKMFNMQIKYPEIFDEWRDGYEKLREGIAKLPIISVLSSAASYNWILISLIFYYIQRGRKKELALLAPLCIQLLISLAGSTNGWYFRYTYPIAICIPVVLLLCPHMSEEFKEE